ncbi:ribose transport system ATP-binding protein [Modicisalibacter ilicicola DSM 19980]|uniref:Ribose transport system ATP-binding protein n=1 Tax=Modicisalibacter ilicicola DSM 19980 TaxID=1121942 RepID=A0A1M5EWB7_9GAMM|nr:sugar ABC transporter ATP-binding protein [Halomonas ilicicola]SHF83508.1 ribose transport system ATP-binding protein [Halomonas ilicicola DSM 19980]
MAANNAPLMELRGIDKAFAGVKVLEEVDLSLHANRVQALAGENGAGKSTLMKILTGVYRADAGSITLRGDKVRFTTPRQAMDAGIAIIHQELNLIPTLSAGENIFLGREPRTRLGTVDWPRLYRDSSTLLERLQQRIDPRTPVSRLSIGQQQMVEIARALSLDAEIIVMDEPTDSLTDIETDILEQVIATLRDAGKSLVLITHRLAEIFRMCDDVAVLRDGKLIHQGPTAEMNEDMLIRQMVGRELADRYPYEPPTPGDTLIEVADLVAPGVEGVSFHARAGEVLGFGGLMGAGRTEMAQALCGDVGVISGQVRLRGREVRFTSPRQALRAGLVYVPEDRKQAGLLLDHPVGENMSLTALPAFCGPLGIIRHGQENAAIRHYIDAFSIKLSDPRQHTETLSGGNQQKVSLAKALMCQPDIVILDEPTRGVDVGAKREIYLLINQLKRDGKCVLLISSEMSELLGLSDRIMVLAGGRITGEFTRDEATQEKIMTAAAHVDAPQEISAR